MILPNTILVRSGDSLVLRTASACHAWRIQPKRRLQGVLPRLRSAVVLQGIAGYHIQWFYWHTEDSLHCFWLLLSEALQMTSGAKCISSDHAFPRVPTFS